ncbi:MAG TPA: HD domain-containing phosphohydrolase [Baekduia sp.]|nr:HD domain-containing phosphohydrolase [Baekduia sp.]
MEIRLSDILAALSLALDLPGGQPRGHAERTCLIAMRMAERRGLDRDTRSALFYASLLKDAGCSSTAARVAALYGGDDTVARSQRRRVDFASTPQALSHLARAVAPGASPLRRARSLARILAYGREGSRSIIELRCERGAAVARAVGVGEASAVAILHVDERWDGRGAPIGLAREEISAVARILSLAQCAAVFWAVEGAAGACGVARRRRATWFEPALVDELCALEGDDAFWATLHEPDVSAVEPSARVLIADDERIDRICEAFAGVIDAKSPFTARHSEGVAEIAVGLAQAMGLPDHEARRLHRGGLLHDIGKLGVSSAILDKPGRLDDAEWAAVRRHPRWSMQILQRIPAFLDLAHMAAAHHERLDGSGYFRGLRGEHLDRPARILAVADVAEALSSERPYRAGLDADAVLGLMRREAGTRLDADAYAALEQVLPAWRPRAAAAAAA